MASEKKFYNIVYEIYKRWYASSTPSADYDELIENAYNTVGGNDPRPGDSEMKKIVYEAYFLDGSKMQDIIDEVCKENKVSKSDKTGFGWLFLGHGPYIRTDGDLDEENEAKFAKLVEKVNNGELIKFEDLFHMSYDKYSSKDSISKMDLMRLYEYNRKSHKEEAAKYFEMLKNCN